MRSLTCMGSDASRQRDTTWAELNMSGDLGKASLGPALHIHVLWVMSCSSVCSYNAQRCHPVAAQVAAGLGHRGFCHLLPSSLRMIRWP